MEVSLAKSAALCTTTRLCACVKSTCLLLSTIFSNLMDRTILCGASDRSREKSQISQDFEGQIHGKIVDFARIFGANLAKNQSVKKRPILCHSLFSGKTSLEIDWFCADQTSVFNVFLTEVIICCFNNSTLQN